MGMVYWEMCMEIRGDMHGDPGDVRGDLGRCAWRCGEMSHLELNGQHAALYHPEHGLPLHLILMLAHVVFQAVLTLLEQAACTRGALGGKRARG